MSTVHSTVEKPSRVPPRRVHRRRGGFTMIELIVVIGIIILAAGMMTPQITDFFKGRQLRQLTNTFRSTINSARLKAVNERTQVRLVFFREGIRVYDERERRFVDEFFNPEASVFSFNPGESPKAWYVLGFYRDVTSVNLEKFTDWARTFASAERARSKKSEAAAADGPTVVTLKHLESLPQIVFRRDGSVEFNVGTDVSSIYYKKDPPTAADLIIYVAGNTSACYIDIQLTGQNRSKVVVLASEPQPPLDAAADPDGEGRRRRSARARG